MNVFKRLFRKAEPEPNPEPLQEVWKPAHDKWREFYTCHCGYAPEGPYVFITERTVCPQCGCQGQWLYSKGRLEWEERWDRYRHMKRNHHFVEWRGCNVCPEDAESATCGTDDHGPTAPGEPCC